ncbi:MAG: tRNA (guanosine(37)-N1)-methyltransferase TrmD [Acidimicrobiales bacterium]
MRIDVLTIFPAMVDRFASESLLGRARRAGLLDLRVHDLRDVTTDVHRTVDDTPSGAAPGWCSSPSRSSPPSRRCSPSTAAPARSRGRRFDQALARELAGSDGFSLLCGRYEGVDERVRRHLCDGEVSIGDVVLAGGEVAAMVVLEAVGRLVPGVMGNAASGEDESFSDGLLEYPQYTKPADFRGFTVPEVLRSGDHARIARWRQAQSLRRTLAERPDLVEARGGLTAGEQALLDEVPPDP